MTTTEVHFVHLAGENENEYTAEIKITSFGSPPSWDGPGDPPEFEIQKILDSEGREIKPSDPLYDTLGTLADKEMEEFDWGDALASEQDYQDELDYETYRDQ